MNVFSKVFGTRSQREVKRIMPLVEKTESYQSQMQQLTDEQLRDKTREYKKRLAEGATLDDLLPEAFATVREAAKRDAHHRGRRLLQGQRGGAAPDV